ncbi:MAG TPA: alkaline phosphatase family protein [Ktedonobacterales bacterium]
MRLNRLVIALIVLGVVAVLVIAWFVAPSSRGTVSQTYVQGPYVSSDVPQYQHIFYIMMENHSYDDIIGNPNAPQLNAYAHTYALATSYYGVTHPSEPNYVAAIGGSYYGIQDDAAYNSTAGGVSHTISAPSIVDQLEGAGLTWKTYQQALPYAGFTGTAYPSSSNALYASKHNPFLNFAHIQNNPTERQNIVPDTQLFTDLQSAHVPNFSFIAPDQCHDMHGTASCTDDDALLQAGDAYVASVVSAITASTIWAKGNNAIVSTWDENDSSPFGTTGCCNANPGGGHVATIVIANHGPRGVQDATPYNHYSLLKTIEDAFHLGCLQNTCDIANVKPMTPLFVSSDTSNN